MSHENNDQKSEVTIGHTTSAFPAHLLGELDAPAAADIQPHISAAEGLPRQSDSNRHWTDFKNDSTGLCDQRKHLAKTPESTDSTTSLRVASTVRVRLGYDLRTPLSRTRRVHGGVSYRVGSTVRTHSGPGLDMHRQLASLLAPPPSSTVTVIPANRPVLPRGHPVAVAAAVCR